ncbi:hypothetical protein BMETH_284511191301, partial [methanotrophic bacterial endosymbiont of Bathymodiolus sp.]
ELDSTRYIDYTLTDSSRYQAVWLYSALPIKCLSVGIGN